jgi:hypothetical protein
VHQRSRRTKADGWASHAKAAQSTILNAPRAGASDPEAIVQQLATHQDAFLDVECGTNSQAHPREVHEAFRLLYGANAPSLTIRS